MDHVLLISTCCNCGLTFGACPDCVNTIQIDPETGLPPDVVLVNGKTVRNSEPDPEAVKRSQKQPVCDNCIQTRNRVMRGRADPIMTSEERHRSTHTER